MKKYTITIEIEKSAYNGDHRGLIRHALHSISNQILMGKDPIEGKLYISEGNFNTRACGFYVMDDRNPV